MGILRLLLAIAVIIAHGGPILGIRLCGGGTAVELFFSISGYYMALVLNTKYKQTFAFYRARLIRLLPVYWISLAITVLGFSGRWWFKGTPKGTLECWVKAPPHGWSLVAVLLTNRTFLGSNFLNSFPTPNGGTWLDYQFVRQSWSLGVEILFYASAPFLVRSKTKIMLSIAGSLALFALLSPRSFLAEFFEYQWPLFLCGALVWHLSPYLRKLTFMIPLSWLLVFFAPLAQWARFLYFATILLALPSLLTFTNRHSWDRLIAKFPIPSI